MGAASEENEWEEGKRVRRHLCADHRSHCRQSREGRIREITSSTTIDFLFEWPEDKRDVLYEAALNTCFMAHDGLKPVKAARDAIRAFGAKKASLRRNLRSSPG
ncbi:DUF982 domain-containing protein [Mesorhizobium koreense]|uniref:DUF982 domain-containing protein n=1 Tax=Mesorhizobium koreense TaxID=3074855 RepID=UPI00287B91DB|nr:DUF982 domain-containing protein [Mesorhizobium sp. WR6]